MMMIEELSPVPTSALPIAALAAQLRLGQGFSDDGGQNDLLEAHLRAALAQVEAKTGKALILRSFQWELTRWRQAEVQPLPIRPVRVINDLDILASDGSGYRVPGGDYVLESHAGYARIVARGPALPFIPKNGRAVLSFQAGYGPDWGMVPADLAQAVLTLAAHYYEERSGQGRSDLPPDVTGLLAPHRPLRIGGWI
jgi:uncharacterized phiE125 gp8 family phage protein